MGSIALPLQVSLPFYWWSYSIWESLRQLQKEGDGLAALFKYREEIDIHCMHMFLWHHLLGTRHLYKSRKILGQKTQWIILADFAVHRFPSWWLLLDIETTDVLWVLLVSLASRGFSFIDHRAQAVFLACNIHFADATGDRVTSGMLWAVTFWLFLKAKLIDFKDMLLLCSEYPTSHFPSITSDAKRNNLFFIRDWILVSSFAAFKLPGYLNPCIFSFFFIIIIGSFVDTNRRHTRRGSLSHN